MATHTPGPWRVDHRRIGDTLFNEQRVYDPKGGYTATFDSEPLLDWFVEPVGLQVGDEANARIIAAAPDLLAALKRVILDRNEDGELALSNLALAIAEVAINRAEGN